MLQLQRKEEKVDWLLEPEIRGFQDTLAGFIMDEVVSAKGIFSITRATTPASMVAAAKQCKDRLLKL